MDVTSFRDTRKALLAEARRPRLGRYCLIGVILAAVLLYLALRGIDWRALGRTLAHTDLSYLPLAFFVFTVGFILRGLRWRVVLVTRAPLSRPEVFWANMVGYLGNCLLPARAGELIRSALIASRSTLTKSFVLATALTERMLDAIALVLITTGALLISGGVPAWLHRASKVVGGIGAAGLVLVIFLPQLDSRLVLMLNRAPLLNRRVRERLAQIAEQFLLGMRSFRSTGTALAFTSLTIVIWLADGVVALTVAAALHLNLSLPVALLLLAALGLASALPSTPGYIGVYQFVAITVLPPFGFTRSEALAFILMFQCLTYLLVSVWGIMGIWKLNRTTNAPDNELVVAAAKAK